MTPEQFLAGYAERSGMTPGEVLSHGQVLASCFCGDDVCEGWQVTHPDNLASWRGESVVLTVEDVK